LARRRHPEVAAAFLRMVLDAEGVRTLATVADRPGYAYGR
jgi:hypothetical protein